MDLIEYETWSTSMCPIQTPYLGIYNIKYSVDFVNVFSHDYIQTLHIIYKSQKLHQSVKPYCHLHNLKLVIS